MLPLYATVVLVSLHFIEKTWQQKIVHALAVTGIFRIKLPSAEHVMIHVLLVLGPSQPIAYLAIYLQIILALFL